MDEAPSRSHSSPADPLATSIGTPLVAGIEAQPVLYPGDTQIEIINTGGAHTAGVSHCLGHSGAVYLKEPLVAATNIFELSDTQSQGENDPQTAVDFLQGA